EPREYPPDLIPAKIARPYSWRGDASMQTVLTPSVPARVPAPARCAAALVIFTTLDEVLTAPQATLSSADGASFHPTLEWLASRDVPVVYISNRDPGEILALQSRYGVQHPFVCDGGASLHIPDGYFPQLT